MIESRYSELNQKGYTSARLIAKADSLPDYMVREYAPKITVLMKRVIDDLYSAHLIQNGENSYTEDEIDDFKSPFAHIKNIGQLEDNLLQTGKRIA